MHSRRRRKRKTRHASTSLGSAMIHGGVRATDYFTRLAETIGDEVKEERWTEIINDALAHGKKGRRGQGLLAGDGQSVSSASTTKKKLRL